MKNGIPIVVSTVPAKKKDCPNLQFGCEVAFPNTVIPRSFAASISAINRDNSIAKKQKIHNTVLIIISNNLSSLSNQFSEPYKSAQ